MSDRNWHALHSDEVLQQLQGSTDGLANKVAQERLAQYGYNRLPEGKTITLWQIILHQLINPLIFILIAAAIASLAIGESKDAVFIVLVIIINSGLGTYQEFNAERSAQSLKSLLKIRALVRRDNKKQQLDAEQLVPGDIVFIETGLKVPADMRLLETANLTVDESFLTGESVAVYKETGVLPVDTAISERSNIAFAGAMVLSGRAMGVVVATGLQTQVGQIAQDVEGATSAKPPLVRRMELFTKRISIFILVLSVILAIILRLNGMDMASVFFFVVALAVSAIPEGLPVALTVALSIASRRMAKRQVIVRRLAAVESLGSCTVIASDKTGTLTVNEQTVRQVHLPDGQAYYVSGQGYNGEGEVHQDAVHGQKVNLAEHPQLQLVNTIGVMANEASLQPTAEGWKHQGDAMDVALLGLSYKLDLPPEQLQEQRPILDAIPYESEKKFAATVYHEGDGPYLVAKGATETIVDFCDKVALAAGTQTIDKQRILQQADQLARQGFRVLAFAGKTCNRPPDKLDEEALEGLTFYGLVSFIDPLRAEAKRSVAKCKQAGIDVIMITGDHPETAKTIAEELGLMDHRTEVVTGHQLRAIGDTDNPAYLKLVQSAAVFARVSPDQKLDIVDVLIKSGEFVAVTGDGVNDAPALKRANMGVAMGSGTDVAKEVSSMIVIDDNFSSIVNGVEEGRFAYDNVRKVIFLLISTGAAEIFLFLMSVMVGLPLPLLPVQLLWLNLVTNGIQDVALAFEGGEPGAMQRQPRSTREGIFNPLMLQQMAVAGLTMGAIVFGLWYALNHYTDMTELHARNMILLLMVFMQNFHAFNCRSERISVFRIPLHRNWILVIGVLVAQLIHILSMNVPFMQNILRVEPITLHEWGQILVLAIPMLLSMELFKWIKGRTQSVSH